MPKGKGKRDYPREIEEAAKRMQKRPEYLKAASDSEEWHNFLQDNDIWTSYSKKGDAFWSQVRDKVTEKEIGFTTRGLAEQGVVIMVKTSYRDIKGRFTRNPYLTKYVTSVVSYRNYETGRFISPKSLKKY